MSPTSSGARQYVMPIALLIIVSATLSVSGCLGLTGCNLFNTQYTYDHTYTVTITGLNNCSGSDGFRILLPAPMLNGAPAYTGDEIKNGMLIFPPPVSAFADYQTVHESRLVNNSGWTASLVDTEKGPMIALTPANASLSDIMYILTVTKDVPASEREQYQNSYDNATDCPLHPVSADPSGSFVAPDSPSGGNFSSYMFLDGTLAPRPGVSPGNITVSLEYHELFAEGSVPTFRQGCEINDTLSPQGQEWIQVTVR